MVDWPARDQCCVSLLLRGTIRTRKSITSDRAHSSLRKYAVLVRHRHHFCLEALVGDIDLCIKVRSRAITLFNLVLLAASLPLLVPHALPFASVAARTP